MSPNNPLPTSVNWHVWPRCNYACRFCFATFASIRRALPFEESIRIPGLLARAGTSKLTFVGGEPTLCPYLVPLIAEAQRVGLVTMLVTNGSRLTDGLLGELRESLTWIGLSIDSGSEVTEKALGRGRGDHVQRAMAAADAIRSHGIRIKINTVVTSLNWQEDLHDLIRAVAPERWKVFQMLPIEGENDRDAKQLAVSRPQFEAFLERHRDLSPVAESNDAMTGSYVMLDPLGRPFQNWEGRYVYGPSILEAGVPEAINATGWDSTKFKSRGGLYDWQPAAPSLRAIDRIPTPGTEALS